jgi:hypothetical protein
MSEQFNPKQNPIKRFGNYFTPDFSKTKYGNSSWWLGGHTNSISESLYSRKESNTLSTIKKASAKRSIANFVNIVTGQQIPVEFAGTGGISATDGKRVYISANVDKPEEFDVAVGLALHEGSHIKLSNFGILSNLGTKFSSQYTHTERLEILKKCKDLDIDYIKTFKDILNWIEDRRIDQFIYNEAPGYQGYYQQMYETYFNSSMIEMGLKSTVFSDETLESYMFHLINMHSKFARPNALKVLPKINSIVDLNNISRLTCTEDVLPVAAKVFQTIIEAIEKRISDKQQPQPDEGQEGEGEDNGQPQIGNSDPYKKNKSTDKKSKGGKSKEHEDDKTNESEGDETNEGEGGNDETNEGEGDETNEGEGDETLAGKSSGKSDKSKENPQVHLTRQQIEKLLEDIKKQENFIAGNIEKAKMTNDDIAKVKQIEDSKTEIKVVGQEFRGGGTECIVVKNLTQSILESSNFPIKGGRYENEVNQGLKNGLILGRKLQTRSESRETVYNRQFNGKIDKRQISSIGYGCENVFFTKEIDMYKKANLHISVDASGSMTGQKWKNTMINIVTLAKACDMIDNLNCQISFRTTAGYGNDIPYIVIAYDSRVDKISKIKNLFPRLSPDNTTPEGLCFESILKVMVQTTKDVDSYFVNLSDGEPFFSNNAISYSGHEAAKHTNKMVKKILDMNIKVLAYYVSDSPRPEQDGAYSRFKECYGPASHAINITSINEIAKTMNNLFMKKGVKN